MNAYRTTQRPHSRRGIKTYSPENTSNEIKHARIRERAPEQVALLSDAGSAGSALRRALRAQGIDPKLARLTMLFYGLRFLRPSEIAWRLNISPATASRWLDRAERVGLVDKFYDELIDRRVTQARLTMKGMALRDAAVRTLHDSAPFTHPKGLAYGRRRAHQSDFGYE